MSVQMINTNIKPGCCPHGFPIGTCPICSGMSGGGSKVSDSINKKSDEWSYAKCYSVWQKMLAKEAQQEANQQARINFQANILAFQKNMQNFIAKTDAILATLQTNLPKPLAKTLNVISQKVLIPVLKMLENLPNNVQKTIQNIQKVLTDISDKLVAIFGELKNSIEKRLQKAFKSLKTKIFSLFSIFNVETSDEEEDKKIDEAKRIFNLKNLKNNILKILEENAQGDENGQN